jgi:hypothetical protein
LDLYVVAPLPALSLGLDVGIDVAYDVVLEEGFLELDVVHAGCAYLFVVLLGSVQLVGNGAEETVTVLCAFLDGETLREEVLPKLLAPLLQEL